MLSRGYDLAVVGAGIAGLAHAYMGARRGWKVLVLERGDRAQGASIRNFGMIWPIGQPAGERYQIALRSREHWLEVLKDAGLWHEQTGSLHLAHEADEERMLQEVVETAPNAGFTCELWSAEKVRAHTRGVRIDGLRAALWSPTEVCVDPRQVIAELPRWLAERHGVDFEFATAVTEIEGHELRAGSKRWRAERIVVCSGDELRTLYPQILDRAGLLRCKLQMMRTEPAAPGWRVGPMLAAGLTLRHYKSFAGCPSLAGLNTRFDAECPDFGRYGIHVMVSQNGEGELILGDSHEYDDDITPFDKVEIENLILGYLARFFEMPGLRIASRWNGQYVKHPSRPCFTHRPEPHVLLLTGLGGAGMTLSFGLAEQSIAAF